jgi:hypothetical protein
MLMTSGTKQEYGYKTCEEFIRVVESRQPLMAILAEDKDIKERFSGWIESLIRYRGYTSEQMSKFYTRAVKSHEHLYSPPPPVGVALIQHEEYDMTNICNDIESVYDY